MKSAVFCLGLLLAGAACAAPGSKLAEAGAADDAKTEGSSRKAAANGDRPAPAALEVMKQRTLRRADLDYWISAYDGAELVSGQFRCPAPRLPALSKTNEEIARVAARVAAWQACYNKAAQNLNAASPLAGRIPADIAKLLNKEELERATVHLGQVEEKLTADARISARMVLADVAAWRSATETYVREHNAIVNSQDSQAPAR